MRTGIPLFNVLNADGTTYNGRRSWTLPARRKPGEWRKAEDDPGLKIIQEDADPGEWIEQLPGQALGVGHGGGGNVGFYLCTADHVLDWYRPGARLFLAEGAGALHRKVGHALYSRCRLIREITLDDGLIDQWKRAYMFCLLAARDRGEIEKIDVNRYSFARCSVRGASFAGSKFRGVSFAGGAFQDCWFDGCEFERCNFNQADLYNAKFRNCTFRQVSFRSANLFHVDFSSSTFDRVTHHLAQVGFTVFRNCKGLETLSKIKIPDELTDAVMKLHAAGFGVYPGTQGAVQSFHDYELDLSGETIDTNYWSEITTDDF